MGKAANANGVPDAHEDWKGDNVDPEMTVVLARFEDAEIIRRAFTQLQNHGVDAADIRIGGVRAEEVQASTREEGSRARLDHRLEGFVTRRAITGASIGAALGAVLGTMVAFGAVNLGDLRSDQRLPVFLLVVLALAVIGAVLGGFVLVERSVGYDDTWQLTLDIGSEEGAWIAVRVADAAAQEAVLGQLREMTPAPSKVDVHAARTDGAHTVQW
jgi:hypothetical protein